MEFLMEYIKLEWENRNRLESEVKLERERRQQLEAEVETLKTLLEPLQKKELEFYRQKHHTAIQNIRKDYYRNGLHGGGRGGVVGDLLQPVVIVIIVGGLAARDVVVPEHGCQPGLLFSGAS